MRFALICLAGPILFAPCQTTGFISSSNPTKVVAELKFVATYPFNPRFDKNLEFIEQYCEIDCMRSAASWYSGDGHSNRLVQHHLFRDGEKLYAQKQYKNNVLANLSLVLYSKKANPSLTQPRLGEIFASGSFPFIGCIEGYLLEDYFPQGRTEMRQGDNDEVYATATSIYGRARAWLDINHGNLPKRIVIKKTKNHVLVENLTVGDEQLDRDEPLSLLVSKQIELNVQEFGVASSGDNYIKKCALEVISTSKRGLEAKIKCEWTLKEIDFNPESLGGKIFPVFDLEDGHAVSVKDAPQIPYIWSRKERWAVPDKRFMTPSVDANSSRRFIFVLVGILALLLVSLLFYRFKGSRR